MFKEIKNLIFVVIIVLFAFFTIKYYFSDNNKKKSYRSSGNINKRIENFTKKLPILEDDTKDIIQYVEKSSGNKKKKFNFWNLLESND